MMIDTSPWSSCSRRSPWSPWLPCSSHTFSSTGPSVSPFRDFLFQAWSQKIKSFGPSVAKLWPKIFQYISIYFSKSWLALVGHRVNQKQKLFREGFALDYVQPSESMGVNARTPKKMFLSEILIFRKLRVSLGYFGQQAPESPVSQLENGVSTASLPPFIVDLLTFKVYPRSNLFFRCASIT